MKVTHLENDDSQLVLGGSDLRSFGISDNAEFITMLSEGLYSDKKKAVVREVMCNAHDAHVISNRLDKPIEITLNAETLTIKDFGWFWKEKLLQTYNQSSRETKNIASIMRCSPATVRKYLNISIS